MKPIYFAENQPITGPPAARRALGKARCIDNNVNVVLLKREKRPSPLKYGRKRLRRNANRWLWEILGLTFIFTISGISYDDHGAYAALPPATTDLSESHRVHALSYSPTVFNEYCVDYTVDMIMTPVAEYANDVYNLIFSVPKQNFELTEHTGFTLDDTDPTHYILTRDVVPSVTSSPYRIKVRIKAPGFTDLPQSWAISAHAKHHESSQYRSYLSMNFSQLYKVIDASGSPVYLSDHIYPEGVGLVPASQACVQPQNIIIKGKFIIDEDYCFATSSSYLTRLYMEEESGIEIASGSQLTLRGAQLRGCDHMWDGIEVADGSLVTEFGYQAPTKRTLIEDAWKGIHFKNSTTGSLHGLELTNCRYGVFGGDPSSSGGYSQINVQFNDVHINGSGTLKPYQGGLEESSGTWDWPMSGIEMVNVSAFVSNCTDEPDSGGGSCATIISDCYRGISLINTNAVLSGFYIRDLHSVSVDLPVVNNTALWASADNNAHIQYAGYGKNGHASFERIVTGVKLDNVNAHIRDVRMKAVGATGMDLRNGFYKDILLTDNRIQTRRYGIIAAWNDQLGLDCGGNDIEYHTHQHDPEFGIVMISNIPRQAGQPGLTGMKLHNNNINMPRARAGIHALNNDRLIIAENSIHGGDRTDEYGIHISGGFGLKLDCNHLERPTGSVGDPSAGIYTQMMDQGTIRCNDLTDYPRGIEYFGMSQGSLMEGNTLSDHRIGLLYDHDAETGVHEWSGNRWTNEYDTQNGEIGARNTSVDPNKVDFSKYYVDITPSGTHAQYGTSVESQYDWFVIKEEDFPTLKCEETGFFYCDGGPGSHLIDIRPPDSLAWWIAVDSFTSPNYGDGAVWTAQRQLYRRLTTATEYITVNSEWEDFMDSHATSSVGIYESIRAAWLALPAEADHTREDITLAVYLQDSLFNELADVLNALTESTDSTERQTLIGQISQLEETLTENSLYLDTLYADIAGLRSAHILTLDTINQSAPTSEAWTEAQQRTNALLFKAALEGMTLLDSLDLVALEAIAAECPMVLGESVFQARGLLAAIDPGLHWDDASECEIAELRYSKDVDPMMRKMDVWPNPTRNTLSVDLKGGSPQAWDITLYNAYGSPVKSWNYPSGLYQLELTELPSGVYTLQATGADGQRLDSRVFIAR